MNSKGILLVLSALMALLAFGWLSVKSSAAHGVAAVPSANLYKDARASVNEHIMLNASRDIARRATPPSVSADRSNAVTCSAGSPKPQGDAAPRTPGVELIIQSITASPSNPNPGQEVTITVTIRNQGDSNAGGFYTYLYVDPPTSPPIQTTPDTSYTYIFGLNA